MPTPEERRREQLAQARARLQAALERAIAAEIQAAIDEAAREAAQRVRDRRRRDEAVAAVTSALLAAPFLVRLQVRLYAVADAFVETTLTEIGATAPEAQVAASHAAQSWVRQYAAGQVQDISDSIGKLATRILARAEVEGLTADETAMRLLEGLTGDIAKARSARIAGDIAHAVAGYASDEGARHSQLQVIRVWVSMEDIKVRPTHRIADGQMTGLDQPFLVGGYYLRFPGDPLGPPQEVFNCRCATVYRRIAQTTSKPEAIPARLIGRKP